MKMRVIFKTPDAVHDGATEFGKEKAEATEQGPNDWQGPYKLADYWRDYAKTATKKFVEFDECVTIEFDLEAGTATVIPV